LIGAVAATMLITKGIGPAAPPPPADRACDLAKAESRVAAGRSRQAREILAPCLASDASDARAVHLLGRTFLHDGDLERAIEELRLATLLDRGNSRYLLWLGRAYGRAARRANVLRQPELARKVKVAFEAAVKADPQDGEARFSLFLYELDAPGILGGSRRKAREQAQALTKIDPLRGRHALGLLAERSRDFEEAARQYERAEMEFPSSPAPLVWSARVAARRGDFPDSFALLERVLREHPTEISAAYELAKVALESGRNLPRARECLELYLRTEPAEGDPSIDSARELLARVIEAIGR
jgi:tetratricopeptide (TPR) repeat protein